MTADATHPAKRSLPAPSSHESHEMLSQLFALNHLLFAPTIWEVLETLLQQLQQVLGASSCVLYLDPQEEGTLTLRTFSADPPLVLPQQIPLVNDPNLWSQLRDDWLHQRFASMETRFRQVLPPLASGEQHFLLAPLFRPSSPIPPGLLLVVRDGTWSEAEVLLLKDLASRLAIRLSNQSLREKLEQHQLSGEFLAQLCIAAPDPRQEDLLLRQARFLGADLSKPHVVVTASIAALQGQAGASHQVVDLVEAWLTRTFPGSLVVLQPSSELLGLLDLTHRPEKIGALLQEENQQEIMDLVALWRSIIQGEQKSWVLFEHGTCLILMQPEANLAEQARQIMSTWGPVKAGTSAGDFNVISLPNPPGGWVVTGHHPDMLNYISPQNFADPNPSDLIIGLSGRGIRDQDAHSLNVVHIEDRRLT